MWTPKHGVTVLSLLLVGFINGTQSIRVLEVTAPPADEVILPGSKYLIKWSITGSTALDYWAVGMSLDLLDSTNRLANIVMTQSTAQEDIEFGQYAWTVAVAPGTKGPYCIQITVSFLEELLDYRVMSPLFNIKSPSTSTTSSDLPLQTSGGFVGEFGPGNSSPSLSRGAIGGIAAGGTIAVGILFLMLYLVFYYRRKARDRLAGEAVATGKAELDGTGQMAAEDEGSTGAAEMDSSGQLALEKEASTFVLVELDAYSSAVEMDATEPQRRDSSIQSPDDAKRQSIEECT